MKFGSVPSVKDIKFRIPPDHPDTAKVLGSKSSGKFSVHVGCAKWNRKDLRNFYPRGTKDELTYYSRQFSSIELNATFYGRYPREQYIRWREKTPDDFVFFPKVPQGISHMRRLNNVSLLVDEFCYASSALEEKLGMVFLQMHDNFKPKDYDRLEKFVREFPKGTPLAVELRNAEWFSDKQIAEKVFRLFRKYKVTSIIVDSAGRRDVLHMRLTTKTAFIRFVGANDPSDYTRLDPWVKRIAKWKEQGLQQVAFFLHQNYEKESPELARYFIEQLNRKLKTNLRLPELLIP